MLPHELSKALNVVETIHSMRNVVRSWLSRQCELIRGFHDPGIVLLFMGGLFQWRAPLGMAGTARSWWAEVLSTCCRGDQEGASVDTAGGSHVAADGACMLQSGLWCAKRTPRKGMWWEAGSALIAAWRLGGLCGSKTGLFPRPNCQVMRTGNRQFNWNHLLPSLLGVFLLQELQLDSDSVYYWDEKAHRHL